MFYTTIQSKMEKKFKIPPSHREIALSSFESVPILILE